MKTFPIGLAVLALAAPVFAQGVVPQAVTTVQTTVNPLKAINTPVQADGRLYEFLISVRKKDPTQTTGFILDDVPNYLWDPSNPWSPSQGYTAHPGWGQVRALDAPQGSEMFPRFQMSTNSPTVALTSLGYLLLAQGKRLKYYPPGPGGGPGAPPTPERWGADSVNQSIDAITPNQTITINGKPTIVVWQPFQVLGSTSAGHYVDPKDPTKDGDFPYSLTLQLSNDTNGATDYLRGSAGQPVYDVTSQIKNSNLIKYPQQNITFDPTIIDPTTNGRKYFGPCSLDLTVASAPNSSYGAINATDTAHITILSGKLGIIGNANTTSTELTDDQKNKIGGYVALNNDNDDYRFNGTTPVVDSTKTDATPGENDLVGLKLHALMPKEVGGTYKLRWEGGIKIWRTSDKSVPAGATSALVSTDDQFDATTDTQLYVEGVTDSTAAKDAKVHLDWLSPAQNGANGQTPGTLVKDLDIAPFTVYEVDGPGNVPGYARYTYTASVPGAGATDGTWTAESGTTQVKNGTTGTPPVQQWKTVSSIAGNTAQILWDGGPVIGYADFAPNSLFKCKRDVNVVQVVLDFTKSNLKTYNPPVDGNAGGIPHIDSVARGRGNSMEATAIVKSITGPTRAGDTRVRGVRYIEIGFIQNGEVQAWKATFGNPATATSTHSMQAPGVWLLDVDTGSGSTAPWYRSATAAKFGLTDTNYSNLSIPTSDWPNLDAAGTLMANGTDPLASNSMIVNFRTFFVVHTNEDVNGSAAVYTQRAVSTWTFNGSGSGGGPTMWTANATNNGGPSFTEVTTGDVPVTTGTAMNNVGGAFSPPK